MTLNCSARPGPRKRRTRSTPMRKTLTTSSSKTARAWKRSDAFQNCFPGIGASADEALVHASQAFCFCAAVRRTPRIPRTFPRKFRRIEVHTSEDTFHFPCRPGLPTAEQLDGEDCVRGHGAEARLRAARGLDQSAILPRVAKPSSREIVLVSLIVFFRRTVRF